MKAMPHNQWGIGESDIMMTNFAVRRITRYKEYFAGTFAFRYPLMSSLIHVTKWLNYILLISWKLQAWSNDIVDMIYDKWPSSSWWDRCHPWQPQCWFGFEYSVPWTIYVATRKQRYHRKTQPGWITHWFLCNRQVRLLKTILLYGTLTGQRNEYAARFHCNDHKDPTNALYPLLNIITSSIMGNTRCFYSALIS